MHTLNGLVIKSKNMHEEKKSYKQTNKQTILNH